MISLIAKIILGIILFIIGIIVAPFMTIGILILIADLGIGGQIFGIIFLVLGLFHMIDKLSKMKY